MVGGGTLESLSAGRGEGGICPASVAPTPDPFDESGCHQPVEPTRQAARRQQEAIGQLAHAHPATFGLGQVDEDAVVGEGHPLAGLELGVETCHQERVGAQQRAPCLLLHIVQPGHSGHQFSVPEGPFVAHAKGRDVVGPPERGPIACSSMSESRPTLDALCEDLRAEHADLDGVLASLDDGGWDAPTPAAGWAVRDHVSHLAFFDDAATLAITDPTAFTAFAEQAIARGGDPMEDHLRRGRAMKGGDVLEWWRQGRDRLFAVSAGLGADARVPWFGPPMGLMSFLSARLMETWAHGQDVVDGLGLVRPPTKRLRHVAHLGVKARPFSYAVRGRPAPEERVRVSLTGPSGERWEWDTDAGSQNSVSGSALDFCLVVTQRRNVLDADLIVDGSTAREWLSIAQAFAGPPGPGRPPRAGSDGPTRSV